jgi:hypothetical protein
MNTVLIVLGVLGVGAILISAYVFTVAARNYVSDSSDASNDGSYQADDQLLYIVRSNTDRRSDKARASFPMTLPGGQIIQMDRRREPERRVSNG